MCTIFWWLGRNHFFAFRFNELGNPFIRFGPSPTLYALGWRWMESIHESCIYNFQWLVYKEEAELARTMSKGRYNMHPLLTGEGLVTFPACGVTSSYGDSCGDGGGISTARVGRSLAVDTFVCRSLLRGSVWFGSSMGRFWALWWVRSPLVPANTGKIWSYSYYQQQQNHESHMWEPRDSKKTEGLTGIDPRIHCSLSSPQNG